MVPNEITGRKKANGPAFGSKVERFTALGIHPQRYKRNPAFMNPVRLNGRKESRSFHKLTTREQLFGSNKFLGDKSVSAESYDSQQISTLSSFRRQKKRELTAADTVANKRRIPGMDWTLSLKSEMSKKIPCVLYMDTWEKNKEKEELMGPTKYNVQDVYKPCYTSGLMNNKEPRFHSCFHKPNNYPGPGSYGKKGNPYPSLSDVGGKGKKTLMSNTGRKQTQTSLKNDYLAPNVYFKHSKTGIEQLVSKVVSLRGPYDLFSGNRAAKIRTGWLAENEVFDVKSEPYNPSSTSKKPLFGTFSKIPRTTWPTGRLACETNAHPWIKNVTRKFTSQIKEYSPFGYFHFQKAPGPADYSPKYGWKKCTFNVKPVAFGKGDLRFDPVNARRFFHDYGTSGPGRYDIKSSFDNSLPQLTPKQKRKTPISEFQTASTAQTFRSRQSNPGRNLKSRLSQ